MNLSTSQNHLFIFILVLAIALMAENQLFAKGPSDNEDEISYLVDSLITEVKNYRYNDPALALQLGNELYQIADSLNIDSTRIDVLSLLSRVYSNLGDMDSAMFFCQEAIHYSNEYGDSYRIGYAIFQEGVILYSTTNHPEALEKFRQSYYYYVQVKDTTGMSNALNAIGASFSEMSEFDSAVVYYMEGLKIAERINNERSLGRLYINLGVVHDHLNENDLSKQMFHKAIRLNKKLNNRINVAKAINNLSNIHVQDNNLDSAWFMYNKALEISIEIPYVQGQADAYNGLGDVAFRQNNYVKALEYFTKAKRTYESINYQQGQLIAYLNLGKMVVLGGDIQRGLIIYDSCIQMAKAEKMLDREAEILENRIDAYARAKNFEKAFLVSKDLAKLEDSIFNIEKQKTVSNLMIFYEVEKNKAENFSLKSQNLEKDLVVERRTIQRNTYLFSGTGIVVVLVFLFSYYSQRTRKNRVIAEQRIRQLEEEKKLLAARSIVVGQEEERKRIAKELHDGLGVLLSSAKMHFVTLRDKTPENIPMIDKAAKLLEQATGDVRRISHNMMPGLLTKYGFYEACLDLFEQIEDMKGISPKIDITGDQSRLHENTEIMLYRIVQEMVNNTLKHAQAKHVSLEIQRLPSHLRMLYSDDGQGFELSEKMNQKSMGLNSIQSRVKFLGGKVEIDSSPGQGVRIDIQVPIV